MISGMVSLAPTLLALAAASLVSASPFPKASARTGFTVNQSTVKPFRPGPVHRRHVYAKYGIAAPSDVEAAALGQGDVTTTPTQYDSEYLTPVTIGGDQLFDLDFDTGSSDL